MTILTPNTDLVLPNNIKPSKTEYFEKLNIKEEIKRVAPIKVKGWNLLIRLRRPREKTKAGLIIPDEVRIQNALENSFVGLVVQMSEGAYKDERYKESGPWCSIGDYVLFSKNAGYHFNYKEAAYIILYDDCVNLVVDDPELCS